jgi:hypothetical protein
MEKIAAEAAVAIIVNAIEITIAHRFNNTIAIDRTPIAIPNGIPINAK